MFFSDAAGTLPGIGPEYDEFVNQFTWSDKSQVVATGNYTINPNTIDVGNSPTWVLRRGLVLGLIGSTQQWTAYNATNVDGSQVARGVLMLNRRMQDLVGNTRSMQSPIMVGGPIIAANLIGLDYQARQQMRGEFIFDDVFGSSYAYPWLSVLAKTANYAMAITDNNTCFTNAGATGAVNLTLPPIQNGLCVGVFAVAAQNLTVTSNEGGNIVCPNDAVGNSVAFMTGGDIIGGSLRFWSNPAGTAWYMDRLSGNALTIT